MRNWGLVHAANFVGALRSVVSVYGFGTLGLGGGAVAKTAARIASAKVELGVTEAFLRGILCNTLVCLAIWLSMAAHTAASARSATPSSARRRTAT